MHDPNDFHSVRLWCCVTIVKFVGKDSSDIRVGMSVSVSNERQLDWGAIYCFSQAASAIWSLPVVFSCCLALAFLCCPSRFALRFVLLRKMSKQIISETTQFHPRYKSNEHEQAIWLHMRRCRGFQTASLGPLPPGWDSNSSDSVRSREKKKQAAFSYQHTSNHAHEGPELWWSHETPAIMITSFHVGEIYPAERAK